MSTRPAFPSGLSFVLSLLTVLCLTGMERATAQDEYPVAMPTDRAGVVISPFDTTRQLDVEGLEPGSLAFDPIAKEVFRIPYSTLSQGGIEDYLGERISPPPVPQSPREPTTDPPARDRPAVSPPPLEDIPVPPHQYPQGPSEWPENARPSWQTPSAVIPEDLLSFLHEFNHLSSSNDPAALVGFYADPVANYFGERNISHREILKDRAAYIKRFPQRSYLLVGEPVLLSSSAGEYEVLARIDYAVAGSGKRLSGSVSDSIRIRVGRSGYEIVGIEEAKAQLPPEPIEDLPAISRPETPGVLPGGGGGVYGWYQQDLLERFLEAFTASGEVNDPAACVHFMHPQIEVYYSLRNPTREQLLRDRARYIERWPERRYWLTEKPQIRALPDGSWEAVSRIGYEVRSSSRYINGETTSVARLAFAPEGLKIVSIRED